MLYTEVKRKSKTDTHVEKRIVELYMYPSCNIQLQQTTTYQPPCSKSNFISCPFTLKISPTSTFTSPITGSLLLYKSSSFLCMVKLVSMNNPPPPPPPSTLCRSSFVFVYDDFLLSWIVIFSGVQSLVVLCSSKNMVVHFGLRL